MTSARIERDRAKRSAGLHISRYHDNPRKAARAAFPSIEVSSLSDGTWQVDDPGRHVLIISGSVATRVVQRASDVSDAVSGGDGVTFLPAGSAWTVNVSEAFAPVGAITIPEELLFASCGHECGPWRIAVAEQQPRIVEAAKWLAMPAIGWPGADKLLTSLLIRLIANTFGRFVRRVDDSWLPAAALVRIASLCSLSDLERLSVPVLAEHAGLGVSAFARAFRGSTGLTPGEYLIRVRTDQVAILLETTDLSVSAIAKKTGLSSVAHLTQQFGQRFGITPGRYRAALVRSTTGRTHRLPPTKDRK